MVAVHRYARGRSPAAAASVVQRHEGCGVHARVRWACHCLVANAVFRRPGWWRGDAAGLGQPGLLVLGPVGKAVPGDAWEAPVQRADVHGGRVTFGLRAATPRRLEPLPLRRLGTNWEPPTLVTAPYRSVLLTCARHDQRNYDSDLVVGIGMHGWGSRGRRFKSGRPGATQSPLITVNAEVSGHSFVRVPHA